MVEREGWVALLALCLLGVGCGGDGSEGVSGGGDLEVASSPIAEFLGLPTGGDDSDLQSQVAEQERAVGEYIVACMAAEGFTYVHPVDGGAAMIEPPDGLEWGSDEWVATYGFGITTQRFPQDQIGADLVGGDQGVGEGMEDPNQEYLNSLSDAEREAYQAALYGADAGPEWDPSLSDEDNQAALEEHWESAQPSGCMNEAYREAEGIFSTANRFYETYGDELDEMYQRIQDDPRVVAARDEAERCVTEAGYEYRSLEDLYQHFESKLGPIEERLYGQEPPQPPAGFDELSETEQQRWHAQNQPSLDEEGRALLGEVQREELELAAVYHECGASEFSLHPVIAEAMVELEQEFLEAHADELAELAG